MTPEQLKASILQYAMEGKLVKQNPDDEPASVLLEKIKVEKEKLIQEGKIKKAKKLPEITDEEKPFDIPDGWKWVRIKEIGYLQTGTTPSIGKNNYLGNYIPFIKPGDIYEDRINYKNQALSEKGLKNGRLIEKHSILTVCIGSIGKSYVTDRPVSCNQQINTITPLQHVYYKYILACINSRIVQQSLWKKASKTTLPIVNRTKLSSIVIPLPPLEEQKRIVAKIEKLMPLVDKYAEAYNRLKKIDDEFDDRLKQSILQYSMEGKLVKQNPDDEPASVLLEKIKTEKEKLIQEGKIKKTKKLPEITDEEKPFGIPDSWEWTRLGDISNFVGTGMVVPKSKQSNIKTEKYKFPYFKMNNIGNWNGNFLLNDLMYIENSPIISRYFLKSNEILFNTRNSKELVGKTTVVPNKLTDKIIANNNILRIDLIQNDSAKFINEYLISPVMRNIFWNITTATTNVAAIYQKQLILILVPLPPLAEQKRIVAKIKKLDYLINQL